MTQAPALPELSRLLDATWAPAAIRDAGGWRLRDGGGGGKRVSAATRLDAGANPAEAETMMVRMGQTPLFMVREGEGDLDAALAARGHTVVDPVTIYAARLDAIDRSGLPAHRVIACDLPLAAMAEIWAAGGIGPARLAVMDRVAGPKTYLLARAGDRPAGVAFVAIHDGVAMLHALEVADAERRKGVGRMVTLAAADWAATAGAEVLALAVTNANGAANALYATVGMVPAGRYHYRMLT